MYKKNIKDFTNEEIKTLITYYNAFATPKEIAVLDRIIAKTWDISEWDGNFIRSLLKRHRVLLVSQERKTDEAIARYRSVKANKQLTQNNSKFV